MSAKAIRRPRRARGGIGLLVYNIDSPGGMERQAGRLAECFVRHGRPVVVVSTFFPKLFSPGKNPKLFEVRNGVLIYRLPLFSSEWLSYPRSQDLYETLAAWILHGYGWVDTVYAIQASSGGLHGARIAHALDRPSVVKLACSGVSGDFHAIDVRPDPEAARVLVRRLDRVVHLNDASRDEALAAGVRPERLVHIPNGIDPAPFRDPAPATLPELGPSEGRELVLFVGRLDQQKRIHVLLEAFARLAERRPRARLAILGQGPVRPELEALAARLGVADRVLFAGVRKDVPSVLRAASVYVLPSAEEGISNALLEAMAAGAPSVASDIPGNRDVLRHEREGLLVPVDDVPALEAALARLLEDRALASRFGAAAQRRIDEVYAIDRVARRYLELFDALPRRRRPSLARFWVRALEAGLTPLAWLVLLVVLSNLRTIAGRFRAGVTRAVVLTKGALGIEGELLSFGRRAKVS